MIKLTVLPACCEDQLPKTRVCIAFSPLKLATSNEIMVCLKLTSSLTTFTYLGDNSSVDRTMQLLLDLTLVHRGSAVATTLNSALLGDHPAKASLRNSIHVYRDIPKRATLFIVLVVDVYKFAIS